MDTTHLIDQAISLPLEERILLIDILLHTLNPTEAEIDKKWTAVAHSRLDDLRSGKVQGLDGEKVFTRIIQKYEK